jgi:hypothetical protein
MTSRLVQGQREQFLIDDLVHGLPLCAKVHVGWIQNQLLHFQG